MEDRYDSSLCSQACINIRPDGLVVAGLVTETGWVLKVKLTPQENERKESYPHRYCGFPNEISLRRSPDGSIIRSFLLVGHPRQTERFVKHTNGQDSWSTGEKVE